MASINRLKPNQIVYSIQTQKMGNTAASRKVLYQVQIVEVHADSTPPYVIASWNGNTPKTFYERSVKQWKVNKPQPKGKVLGMDSY